MKQCRRSQLRRNLNLQGTCTAVLLLAVILIFVLANLIAKDREYSTAENRKLAQTPDFSFSALADGSYFAGWGDYIAEQFVGRDFWISVNLRFQRLLGAKEANGVILADDGYLMEPPAEADEEALAKNLNAINEFVSRNLDLHICMSVVPNAAYVLSEKLPAGVPVRDQGQALQELAQQMEHGLRFIDLSDALRAHKDEPIYYRTDHHWTSLGASYAFEAMAPDLGLGTPKPEYDVYPVSGSFEGTLASRSGAHDNTDTIELYVPQTLPQYYVLREGSSDRTTTIYDRESLDGNDQYAVFLGGNDPRVDIVTTVDTDRTLLICKDSYANCFVQFLLPYYSRIILIDPRYYYGSADSIVAREKVTDVLFLYNFNTFMQDRSLAEVLGS